MDLVNLGFVVIASKGFDHDLILYTLIILVRILLAYFIPTIAMHITFLNIFNKFDSNFASVKSITFEHFYNDCFLENVAEPSPPPHHTFRRKTHSGLFLALTIHHKCSIY